MAGYSYEQYTDPTGHVPVTETVTPVEPYFLVKTLEEVRDERDALLAAQE